MVKTTNQIIIAWVDFPSAGFKFTHRINWHVGWPPRRRDGFFAVEGWCSSPPRHLWRGPFGLSTFAFQKSRYLWCASQTLDLVTAVTRPISRVPTTTGSTETIRDGIAEDTDSEFHVLEAGWIDKPYILNYVLGKKIDKRHVLAVNVNF